MSTNGRILDIVDKMNTVIINQMAIIEGLLSEVTILEKRVTALEEHADFQYSGDKKTS